MNQNKNDKSFIQSKIINDYKIIQKLENLLEKKYISTLIFRGTEDGFESEKFH